MTNMATYLSPIIVAFIALSGIIVPFIVNTIYDRIYYKPEVDIEITPLKNQSIIEIKNYGNAPATNMSLLIDAQAEIHTIFNIFSTVGAVNITFPKYDYPLLEMYDSRNNVGKNFLRLNIPKLTQGDGSNIRLKTMQDITPYENNIDNYYKKNYSVSANYDQGSFKGYLQMDPWTKAYLKFANWFGNPLFVFIFYIVYAAVLWPSVIFYRRKRRLHNFISDLMYNIIDIRSCLNNNRNISPITDLKWKELSQECNVNKDIRLTLEDIRLTFDFSDYLLIDDFYKKLVNRNSFIKDNNINNSTAHKIIYRNEECLLLGEEVLKNVNWEKYREFRITYVDTLVGIYSYAWKNLRKRRYIIPLIMIIVLGIIASVISMFYG